MKTQTVEHDRVSVTGTEEGQESQGLRVGETTIGIADHGSISCALTRS